MQKDVLVTGATGFIGRRLVALLTANGWGVHAVTSGRCAQGVEAIRWHQANLLNARDVNDLLSSVRPSSLVHLAWYTKPEAYWHAPENFAWVTATLDLLDGFSRHGGSKAVIAGTCAEYDWSYGYCREYITPTVPNTVYGTCKNALRQLLESFAQSRSLDVSWGRIFNLYGPHEAESRLVPAVVCGLLRGMEVPCTHGEQIRDFLHVDDVASAFVRILESKETGIFNIGSGEPVKVREIAERIAHELGVPGLLKLGALPSPPNDVPLILSDNRRLSSLGWRPRYTLAEGVSDTIAWWAHKGRESSVPNRA
jgi:nucleoside-diphosphate-sugar epimerase